MYQKRGMANSSVVNTFTKKQHTSVKKKKYFLRLAQSILGIFKKVPNEPI